MMSSSDKLNQVHAVLGTPRGGLEGLIRCPMCAGFFVLSCIFLVTCNWPTSANDPYLVSSFYFSPAAFDSFRGNTQIKYVLKMPAEVSIYVTGRGKDGQEYLVATLMENIHETRGSHAHTWLGDTNAGTFAPVGLYTGVLLAGGQRFETVARVFHN